MQGGLIYFQIQQEGEDLNANFVADPDEVDPAIQEEIIDAVTNHFNTHKPAQVTGFQVELQDDGLYIDFAGENIPNFSIPELEVLIAGTQCVISFDDPQNENNENNNNENNNNGNNEKTVVQKNAHENTGNNSNNSNNNLKGGKRRRNTRRRNTRRRNTRRRNTRRRSTRR